MQWNDEILNGALMLFLDWDWYSVEQLNPLLREKYPQISEAEATAYSQLVREITHYAFDQIEAAYVERISWPEAYQNIMSKYPGVTEESYLRLNAKGHYYALEKQRLNASHWRSAVWLFAIVSTLPRRINANGRNRRRGSCRCRRVPACVWPLLKP
jgi:hypothetical protein